MATASIRGAFPGLIRAIMALALAVAMMATSIVGPAGHVLADECASVSAVSPPGDAPAADDEPSTHALHAGHVCPGCTGAAILASWPMPVASQADETAFATGDERSPPDAAHLPPVEPPRG